MDKNIQLTKLSKCGGCGAKVGAGVLAQLLSDIQVHTDSNLLCGFEKSDDASVYKINEEIAIVQTIDFFPPIVDDPYLFGQIAATNALSDIYAMGGDPKLCLNVLCVPEKMEKEYVHEILKGGYDKVYEAGALITGGHSIYDEEPKYGLSVTGFVNPNKFYKNCGAQPGDILLLTKPIGIGVTLSALKAGILSNKDCEVMFHQLTTLNKYAKECIQNFDIHAMTDVTGFAILGHCLEMAQGSNVKIKLFSKQFSILDGSLDLAKDGFLPSGTYRNRNFVGNEVLFEDVSLEMQDLLFDPQTSGGLLISVDQKDKCDILNAFNNASIPVQIIGSVECYQNGVHICVI